MIAFEMRLFILVHSASESVKDRIKSALRVRAVKTMDSGRDNALFKILISRRIDYTFYHFFYVIFKNI